MAWTTPRTWVTAELVTAALMNTHVRDDLAYLHGDASTIALSNSLSVVDYLRVTNTAGDQKILIGNQDSSGASNPGIIRGSQGKVEIGGGDSWTTSGGTFTATMQVGDGLSVYIGDSANASMAQGLTINQGASDDEILALKSSDVAHGMTSLTETDSYATFHKASGTAGGVSLEGFSEATIAVSVLGNSTTSDTTKSTAAVAGINLTVGLKSGASITNLGANANILTVATGTTTRFILDADGDSHQDVGTAWTNFDAHDDADLLTALSVHVSRPGDPIKTEFRKFLRGNRKKLEALELVTFNRGGHHFVNMSRLTMLLVGAVRQANLRIDRVVEVLRAGGMPAALLKGV